jgi:hypothetical protein
VTLGATAAAALLFYFFITFDLIWEQNSTNDKFFITMTIARLHCSLCFIHNFDKEAQHFPAIFCNHVI